MADALRSNMEDVASTYSRRAIQESLIAEEPMLIPHIDLDGIATGYGGDVLGGVRVA